jgi:hypothetical protein
VGKQLDPLNNVSVQSNENSLLQSIHGVKHIFDSSLLNVTWIGQSENKVSLSIENHAATKVHHLLSTFSLSITLLVSTYV